MKKITLLFFMGALGFSLTSHALSTKAEEGKLLYATCHACHNPANKTPLAPPMWGVQRRYNRATVNSEDFVKTMVAFVKAPTVDKAIHIPGLMNLGLMPAIDLPDETLTKIATYILENEFAPPCDHWQIAIKRAMKNDDIAHAQKDKRKLNRFCN